MGQLQEVRLPDVGDTTGVTVVEVLVQPGDVVDVDGSLITLEGDKASMEVPSPVAGEVMEVQVKVDDSVSENMVIAVIEVDEAAAEKPAEPKAAPEPAPAPAPAPPPPAAPPPAARPPADPAAFKKAHAGPAVRRLARELGVDLARVSGTGRKARITKDDVKTFIKQAMAQPAARAGGGAFALPDMPEIDFSKFGPVETRPLSRIRKLAAANLHRSWLHVPRVTQHEEADITEMEAFRKAHKEEAKKRGFNLTPVAFLLKACATALGRHPEFNASLDPGGENLILKKYYHIGVAVDTPNGLVVPVIRDVEEKGIFELAEELLATSSRAREGKLLPQDYQGAGFTISSLGGIGGTYFSPIVNAPEVAILGVSRSAMKPVWTGGEFSPRLMLPLSLSYDHRVIDGAMAARFIVDLARLLSDLRRLLL